MPMLYTRSCWRANSRHHDVLCGNIHLVFVTVRHFVIGYRLTAITPCSFRHGLERTGMRGGPDP